MIQTWVADVMPLLEERVLRRHYDRLPGWRKEKADRLKGLKKAQSVGAWALYQSMQKVYGFSEDAVYNLSHSGRYAMCAVETGKGRDGLYKEGVENAGGAGAVDMGQTVRLGCDVEMIKSLRGGIVRRFFCPGEEAYIMGRESDEKRAEEFYRYWVLKESFIKAVREGLKLDLRSFEIRIEEGSPALIRQPEEYPERFYYQEYKLGDAKCAVCSTDPEFGEFRMFLDEQAFIC